MAHVQPINHLSLTIDHCALRAHKFLFYRKSITSAVGYSLGLNTN